MRDISLIGPPSQDSTWTLDINVIQGRPALVPGEEENTKKQRAAIAVYMAKGTIPGLEGFGVDWPGYIAGKVSLVECDNQAKANMEALANVSSSPDVPYPMYLKGERGEIQIALVLLNKPEAANA